MRHSFLRAPHHWAYPALYDLVVNLETAADVVVYMAQHPEYQPMPASAKALDSWPQPVAQGSSPEGTGHASAARTAGRYKRPRREKESR